MKIVDLEQGSPEWHAFRRSHIGSSDAAVIMGVNKYKSKAKLWDEKVNGVQEKENGWMYRGKVLEAQAREQFHKDTKSFTYPCVVEHEIFPWCAASLDGLDFMEQFVVEIKCPGNKTHSIALEGEVPEQYYPQIQHQLACTGLDLGYYYSYDGYKGVAIEVKRNESYIQEMLEREKEFWETIKEHVGNHNEIT